MTLERKKRASGMSNMKRFGLAVGLVLLLLAGGGTLWGWQLYQSAQDTVDTGMQEDLERDAVSERRVEEAELDNLDPVSFLLLGTDGEAEGEQGRSDAMLVATVNPEDSSMKLTSIPRDTKVTIPGQVNKDKINHAYAYGGSDLALDTVEAFLDIPLDYVVRVDMEGFTDLVNAVDGVTLENNLAFEQDGYAFEPGVIELEGDEALAYVRNRQDDPDGDAGRNDRQQRVIEALIEEGTQFSSITNVQEIIDSLGDNIRTNLDFDLMTTLLTDYSHVRNDVTTHDIDGEGKTIDGIWYLNVPDDERERISSKLQDHLEL